MSRISTVHINIVGSNFSIAIVFNSHGIPNKSNHMQELLNATSNAVSTI